MNVRSASALTLRGSKVETSPPAHRARLALSVPRKSARDVRRPVHAEKAAREPTSKSPCTGRWEVLASPRRSVHLWGSLNAQFVTSNLLLLSRYKMTITGDPGTTTARTGDTQVGSTSGSAAPARPGTARGCAGARSTRGVPTCAGVSGRGGAGASPRSLVRDGSPTPGLEPRGPRALSDPPAALSGSSDENARHRGGWKSIGPCGRARRADRSRTVRPKFTRGPATGARAHGPGGRARTEGGEARTRPPPRGPTGSRYLSAAERRRPRPAARSN